MKTSWFPEYLNGRMTWAGFQKYEGHLDWSCPIFSATLNTPVGWWAGDMRIYTLNKTTLIFRSFNIVRAESIKSSYGGRALWSLVLCGDSCARRTFHRPSRFKSEQKVSSFVEFSVFSFFSLWRHGMYRIYGLRMMSQHWPLEHWEHAFFCLERALCRPTLFLLH